MSRSVLLSVRPRFAESLLNGTKTAEVRRRFPELEFGTRLYLYSSTPDRSVVGTVTLTRTVRIRSRDVWSTYSSVIDIDRAGLDAYLEDLPVTSILEVTEPDRWGTPVSLTDLREHGVEPAQSYRYLSQELVDKIESIAKRSRNAGRTSTLLRHSPGLRPAVA